MGMAAKREGGGGLRKLSALALLLVLAVALALRAQRVEATILADDSGDTSTSDLLMVGGYYRTSGSTTVALRSFAEYDTDDGAWSNLDGSALLSTGGIQAISLVQSARLPPPPAPAQGERGKDMSWSGERRWQRAEHTESHANAMPSSRVEAIVVGGAFNFLNSSLAATDFGNIALFNCSSNQWEPLGEGCNGVVTSLAMVDFETTQGNVTSSTTTLIVAGRFTECKQTGGTATVSYSSRVGYYNLATKSWYNVAVQPANKTLPAFSAVTALALSADQDFLYLIGRDVEADEAATFYACSTPISASNGQLSSVTWTVMAETALTGGDTIDALGASLHKCYIGGSFSSLYGSDGLVPMPANNLAVFDSLSKQLTTVEGGGTNGRVASISVIASNITDVVYVGGAFTQIGSVPANSIARSVNGTWEPLGAGLLRDLQPVQHLQITALENGNLIAGGVFDRAGDVVVWNTAYWNDEEQRWASLGNYTEFTYYRMYPFALSSGGDIYMTGQTILLDIASPIFEGIDYDHSLVDNMMARFDGQEWVDIRLNEFLIDGLILTVEETEDGCMVVGGAFRKAGDLENVNNLALYNHTSGLWSDLGGGVHGLVFSTSSTDSSIIVGGTFQYAGEELVSNVAVYDKNTGEWSALGEGITSAPANRRLLSVNAIVPSPSDAAITYFGGNFLVDAWDESASENATVTALVAWNSALEEWQVVQREITDGQVIALALDGEGGLYVGGNFTLQNPQNTTQMVFNLGLLDTTVPYNGFSSWRHIPPPCGVVYSECGAQVIHSIAVFPGAASQQNGASLLYIGGAFKNINGNLMNNVAQLSSSGEWLSLGSSGVTASGPALVLSLAFTYDLSTLYVAGVFSSAGSTGVNDIVAYDLESNAFEQLTAVGGWSGFIADLELLNNGVYDVGVITDDEYSPNMSPPGADSGLDEVTLVLVVVVAILVLLILVVALSVLFFNKYGAGEDQGRRVAGPGADLTEEERATWDDYLSFEWEVEYNLLEISGAPLGRGSRSVVHRATYKGQDVAVKIFHAKYNGYYTRDNMCRFISVMRSLRHPSTVHIVGACQDPLSIVMEYATMGSVADVMRISPHRFTWKILKKLCLEAARGMAFLHGQVPPVLHYNLTASNILISHNWAARVSDIGITQALSEELNGATTDTRYAAPEVLKGDKYTEKADVFSFGVVMWEMATLEQAFAKEEHSLSTDEQSSPLTIAEVRGQGVKLRALPASGESVPTGELVSLLEEEEVREWPKVFATLVSKCLHEDPSKRPSFNEVLSALNRCPDAVEE